MTNIEIIEAVGIDDLVTEHVIIDRGNGEFTTMTKAHYDKLEAAKENGTIS
jgi:hypothetical protein